jgi:subtilisin family serine protease
MKRLPSLLSLLLLLSCLSLGADTVPLRLQLPAGTSLFGNPMDVTDGKETNTLNQIFGLPTRNDLKSGFFQKFNNASASWESSRYEPLRNSWAPNLVLNPGEGGVLVLEQELALDLLGTPRTQVVPVPLFSGPQLRSRQILPRADVVSDSGLRLADGLSLTFLRKGSYVAFQFDLLGDEGWSPVAPEAQIGEAFWVNGTPVLGLRLLGPTPLESKALAGQTITLSVRVVSLVPDALVQLQWFQNDVAIPGATGESLTVTLASGKPRDERFHVVARSLLDQARSETAVVHVSDPLQIIEAPVAQTVFEGEPARFCIRVAGQEDDLFQYRWQRLGTVELVDQTNACLELPSASLAHAGQYQVTVVHGTSGQTLTSEPVELKVLERVRITQHPSSQTVLVGASTQFCLEATGAPPLEYQWLHHQEVIPGAVDACLELNEVQSRDSGDYQVVVSQPASGTSVRSEVAKLVVGSRLQIVGQPPSTNVVEGTPVQLCIQAVGMEPLQYRWFHNRQPIPEGTNACLRLRPARLTGAGDYRVQVTDSSGVVVSDVARVEVRRKPVQIDPDAPGYVRGVLVLRFIEDLARPLSEALQAGVPFAQLPFPEEMRALHQIYQATAIRRAHPRIEQSAQRLEHIFILTLNRNLDMRQAAKDYQALRWVDFAEPDPIVKAFLAPNDTLYPMLWGMQTIRADVAWNMANGAGVVIAVIDSGVDYTQCDLQPNIWQNPGETGLDGMGNDKTTNGIDDDGNGLIDDVRGWDFVDNDNAPLDGAGHGTHVAGTVAAVGNNAEGVIGIAYGAKIMVVRGLNDTGGGDFADLMNCMVYAADNGAQIINNSWGGPFTTAWGDAVVDYAHSKGVLVVSAAGNDGSQTCGNFPANSENSMAVGAVEPFDVLSYYSNYGVKTDVVAPGGDNFGPPNDIVSVLAPTSAEATSGAPTFPGGCGSYLSLAGTSMASPHVAGLAALVWQLHPTWSAEEVKQVLRQACVPLGAAGANGFDSTFGFGRIDAANALLPVTPPPIAALSYPRNCSSVICGPSAPTVDLIGHAGGVGFTHYDIQVAPGLDPSPGTFTTLFTSATPVAGGILMNNLQLQTLSSGTYTLRVVSYNNLGQRSEDRNEVVFRSVFLSLPTPKQYVREASIPVHGEVPAALQRVVAGSLVPDPIVQYSLYWKTPSGSPQLFHSAASGVSGFMANWTTATVPEGDVSIQLKAEYVSGAVFTDEVLVLVDKLIRDGWPVTLNETLTLKSPMMADLDGDGANEVIYGASVFQADGSIRPGWDNAPGLGRSNPAVVDAVNQDGKLEVVAAIFSEYFHSDTNAPNCGGPVIYCYPHTGKASPYWSFAAQHPTFPGGCDNIGIPSTISAGDLDGDGKLEIVFSVNYILPPTPQTTVYVLDAATGVLKTSRTVIGYSASSIALANLDAALDASLELVMSRFYSLGSATYVMKLVGGNLVDIPGWPIPVGNDSSDPVVADVDHDGRFEILLGDRLWHADGTAFAGWPISGSLHTTGALVPVCDVDCELDVVLGTDFDTSIRIVDEDKSLQTEVPVTDEDMLTILIPENSSQGVPIVADVTGDGCAEVIRPGPLGYSDGRPNRLYATTTNQFPRHVFESRGTLRSSALVEDLDQDGKTDLLIAGGGKLYAWNLKTTYCPKNPWPMFQHDLAHTGTLPLPAGNARDLYIEDTPYSWKGAPDTGAEPDPGMTGLHMWCSRGIWLLKDCDPVEGNNFRMHQNPEFGQQNCVYAKVCNRGCIAVTNGIVEFYYTKASAGLCWPGAWTLAGSVAITNVPAYGWSLAALPWFPPGLGHYCLLARVISPDDPIGLTTPACIDDYVRLNNNIAWRNVNVLDLEQATTASFEFRVHNIELVPKFATLRLTADGDFFGNGGLAEVDLRMLFHRWETNGFAGANVTPIGGTHVKLLGSPADMAGIYLGPDEERVVQVTITVPHPVPVAGLKAIFNLEVLQIVDAVVVGGVAYEVSTRGEDTDTDGDGIPDVSDPDDDNDGIPDNLDPNPLISDLPVPNAACVAGKPYIFRGGLRDLAALPLDSVYRGYCLGAAYPDARWKQFDETLHSYVFGMTFNGLPSGIAKGELALAARPLSSFATNNSLGLGIIPPCATPAFAWYSPLRSLPEAGSTWEVNPLTRFQLDLAGLPPNGNLATNLLTKLNADHALDLYVQRETLLDWLELRVWTCPAAVFAQGIPHRALGVASLTNSVDGHLLMSNLGNTGGDGAYAHLGQAQGWTVTPEPLDPAALSTGAFVQFMTAGAATGDGNRLLGRARVEDTGTELAARFDFNTLGASHYTLAVKSNGVVLATLTNRSGVAASMSGVQTVTASDSGAILGLTGGDNAAVFRLRLAAPGNLSVPGVGSFTGDELCAVPELGTNVLVIDYRQGVFVNTAMLPSLALSNETVQVLNHGFVAEGEATLNASGSFLLVSGLGNGGGDRVRASLTQPSSSVTIGLGELRDSVSSETWETVNGSWVESSLIGSLNSVADTELAKVKVSLVSPGVALPFQVDAAASALGVVSFQASVVSNGITVASASVPTGTPIATSGQAPRSVGHVWGTEAMLLDFPPGTAFLLNGSPVNGDHLEIVPSGVVGTINAHQSVRLASSGLQELVISSLCERVGNVCDPTSLQVATSGDGTAVLYWEGCGYHLQASSSIELPGQWVDLSSSSPVSLTADQPYRWFRLVCP